MGIFLILLATFCCFGIYLSRSTGDINYRERKDREMVCPECGVTYTKDHEIRHIENNSMCYHCLAIFDDEVREMNRESDRGDTKEDTFQTHHKPSHDWEDIDEDNDFYNEEEEESERNYDWEDDDDNDFDDDWDD